MNKRYIAIASAALLLLNLSACGCQKSVAEETQPATMNATEEFTPTPTEVTLPKGEGVEEIPTSIVETVGVTEPTEAPAQPTEGKDKADATEPAETTVPTEPAVPTVPDETTTPTEPAVPTVPDETTAPTEPAGGEDSGYCCQYAEYLTWSASAQQSFMNTFASPLDYIEWCRAGEAAHADHDTSIKVEGGDLNVGDFIG